MKVKVNGEVYEVPHKDDLDIDETIAVEEAIGLPGPRWETEGGFRVIKGLVWIAMRRKNPNFTYADARFKLGDLEPDEGDEDLDEALGKDDSSAPSKGSSQKR